MPVHQVTFPLLKHGALTEGFIPIYNAGIDGNQHADYFSELRAGLLGTPGALRSLLPCSERKVLLGLQQGLTNVVNPISLISKC